MIRLALLLAILFPPLVVYRVVSLNPFHSDLFSIAKSYAVLLAGSLAVIGVLKSHRAPRSSVMAFAITLTALMLVSSAFSDYPDVALLGAPYSSEGAAVLGAYAVLFVGASLGDNLTLIMIAMAATVLVMAVAAFAEFVGFAYPVWAPYWLIGMDEGERITAAGNTVTALLGNKNHLGLYLALVIPFFTALAWRKRSIPLGLVALAAVCTLWVSESRGGAVGAVAGILAGLTTRGPREEA